MSVSRVSAAVNKVLWRRCYISVPTYAARTDESDEVKRKRLLYQSRKRGMLENCLLLSKFADKHLHQLDTHQLTQYDHLINQPSNDWQLYYWITGQEPVPKEFQNEVMTLLQKHAINKDNTKSV